MGGEKKGKQIVWMYVRQCYDMVVNRKHSTEEKCATIAHELGHLFCGHLGWPEKTGMDEWPSRLDLSRNSEEFEAESVANLVCGRIGIKTPSEQYLADYLNPAANGPGKQIPSFSVENVLRAAGLVESMLKRSLPPPKKLVLEEQKEEQTGAAEAAADIAYGKPATGEATGEAGTSTTDESGEPERPWLGDSPAERAIATMSDAEVDAMLDAIFGPEEGKPKKKLSELPLKKRVKASKAGTRAKKAVKKAQDGDKELGQIAKEGGKAAIETVTEIFAGLDKLFTPKNTLGSGIIFTEESYREAKPHFVKAWRHATQAGKSLRDFVKILMENFGGINTKP